MTDCAVVDPTVTVVLGYGTSDVLYVGPDCVPLPVDPAVPEGTQTETGIWWNTLQLPLEAVRYTYAPESRYFTGRQLLNAVQDASALQITLAVSGADLAAVIALQAAVRAAVWHRATVRVLDDGDLLGEWPVDPALPGWAQAGTTPQGQGLRTVEGGLVLPVNPQVA